MKSLATEVTTELQKKLYLPSRMLLDNNLRIELEAEAKDASPAIKELW
jgi:hypothetical protein